MIFIVGPESAFHKVQANFNIASDSELAQNVRAAVDCMGVDAPTYRRAIELFRTASGFDLGFDELPQTICHAAPDGQRKWVTVLLIRGNSRLAIDDFDMKLIDGDVLLMAYPEC